MDPLRRQGRPIVKLVFDSSLTTQDDPRGILTGQKQGIKPQYEVRAFSVKVLCQARGCLGGLVGGCEMMVDRLLDASITRSSPVIL